MKDLSARRGEPRIVRTFVERIQDNIHRTLSRECQHLFETFLQSVVTRLLSTIFVVLINTVENVAAGTRVRRKLGYKR